MPCSCRMCDTSFHARFQSQHTKQHSEQKNCTTNNTILEKTQHTQQHTEQAGEMQHEPQHSQWNTSKKDDNTHNDTQNKQVNRNTSRNAHTAKPAPPASSSTAAAHATACRVNKENRTANASIPAVSSAKGVCVWVCVAANAALPAASSAGGDLFAKHCNEMQRSPYAGLPCNTLQNTATNYVHADTSPFFCKSLSAKETSYSFFRKRATTEWAFVWRNLPCGFCIKGHLSLTCMPRCDCVAVRCAWLSCKAVLLQCVVIARHCVVLGCPALQSCSSALWLPYSLVVVRCDWQSCVAVLLQCPVKKLSCPPLCLLYRVVLQSSFATKPCKIRVVSLLRHSVVGCNALVCASTIGVQTSFSNRMIDMCDMIHPHVCHDLRTTLWYACHDSLNRHADLDFEHPLRRHSSHVEICGGVCYR